MNILGVYVGVHGVNGTILVRGRVTSVVQLDRITGIKHSWTVGDRNRRFVKSYLNAVPHIEPIEVHEGISKLVSCILDASGISYEEIDVVAIEEGNILDCDFDSQLISETSELTEFFSGKEIHRVSHHRAHQAQAFYYSGMRDAAVLVVDGRSWRIDPVLGAPISTSIAIGSEVGLETVFVSAESLVSDYEFVSNVIFERRFCEGKTMGLSTFGERVAGNHEELGWAEQECWLSNLESGPECVQIPRKYCGISNGNVVTSIRKNIQQAGAVAAVAQHMYEDAILALTKSVRQSVGYDDLCFSGGGALNCIANGLLTIQSGFCRIYYAPNPGDEGMSLGLAAEAYAQQTDDLPTLFGNACPPTRTYISGTEHTTDQIQKALLKAAQNNPLQWEAMSEAGLIDKCASEIMNGSIVAWFQGKSEFGPRALGNRSILCRPDSQEIADRLNIEIKRREKWRPFAPSILERKAEIYFGKKCDRSFMAEAGHLKQQFKEHLIGASHIDGTARAHLVRQQDNPLFYKLLREVYSRTGIPAILNTSFNLAGDPMVDSPDQALDTLNRSKLDGLFIGPFWVRRLVE